MKLIRVYLIISIISLAEVNAYVQENRPNVLFILADDLGWSDLGYMGSRHYESPNIDRLASQGMVFFNFYSGGPVCSPTRASIMTGKYTARTGITTYLITPEKDVPYVTHQMELSEYTIGESFRDGGYVTGYFGKWHLGYEEQHWANHQGFNTAIGGSSSINAWKMLFPDQDPPLDYLTQINYFSPYKATHLEDGPKGEYLTDRLTNEVITFIKTNANSEKPFFAFLSYHTVHTPLEAKQEVIQKYNERLMELGLLGQDDQKNGSREYQNIPEYAAMVQHLDENVGRLMSALNDMGIDDNTIVVFTSDNGGKGTVTSNAPLRGAKHNLYEGGIRVPLIVRWPGNINPDSKSSALLISNDFYPTLLDMAGLPLKPMQHMDGLSFKDILLGQNKGEIRNTLYWHYPHGVFQGAIRKGDYKLLYHYRTGESELYNLSRDISEENDLSDRKKGLVRHLKKKFSTWLQETGARFPNEGVQIP